ncbi:60S ribosomal protein L12-3 [Thelohanellus kitauei]|uniref:Large ribosomal subunit protein uL11 n=1 Tax=Thelohanellus kitauei TaxID=669202 RepID=A0A0C2J6D1_THEKT|nr:60S ribosomal protein L12-3 [Thelohanellus kitauei]
MGPKLDPNQVVEVIIKLVGGELGGASSLGPKLGPYGVPPKKVGEEIMKLTQAFKGYKVHVKLRIQNRQATVEVVPTAPALILKALKEPPRDRKKVKNVKHNGNITFEQVLEIARTMRHKSLAREFKGTVKEILGTCLSIGCTVEGVSPKVMTERINSGEVIAEK